MGGSSGGIIVQHDAVQTLTNPVVHGSLPSRMCFWLDPILAKDTAQWSDVEKMCVAHAYSWALCNLA